MARSSAWTFCEVATSSCAGEMNLDSPGQTHSPNAELNAGFVDCLGPNHAPLLSEDDWQNIPLTSY